MECRLRMNQGEPGPGTSPGRAWSRQSGRGGTWLDKEAGTRATVGQGAVRWSELLEARAEAERMLGTDSAPPNRIAPSVGASSMRATGGGF